MMMKFRKISVCLLLLSAMMGASARSDRVPEERGERRMPPSQYEPRRGPAPDEQWQGGRERNAEPGEGNARNRMSPDERRALRQQIDRAGRDIYPQRR